MEPTTDIVTRIIDLAGDKVAAQIVSEYGGQTLYVRKTADQRGRFVRCGDCINRVITEVGPGYSPNVTCGIDQRWTSLGNWRCCDKFVRRNKEIEAIAKHLDLPIQEVYRLAADHKPT